MLGVHIRMYIYIYIVLGYKVYSYVLVTGTVIIYNIIY